MELKRVVVTGLGAVTPVGNSPEEMWQNLVNGVSGAAPITLFDTSLFKTKFACEVLLLVDMPVKQQLNRLLKRRIAKTLEAIVHLRALGGLETFGIRRQLNVEAQQIAHEQVEGNFLKTILLEVFSDNASVN